MKATFLLADAHEVDDIQFEYIEIKYVQIMSHSEEHSKWIYSEWANTVSSNIRYHYVVQWQTKVRHVMCEFGISVEWMNQILWHPK